MVGKYLYLIPIGLFALLAVLFSGSCSKEYSLEGRDSAIVIPVPIPVPDTLPSTPTPLPQSCVGCANEQESGKWSFTYNNILYCGIIDTAIKSPTLEAFTFYGPSLCSEDSGLVVTVQLSPDKMNRSLNNYTVARAGMYYYDHKGNSYFLQSSSAQPFILVIDSYNHQTKEIRGSFGGTVLTADGRQVVLADGKWKTHLY